jgi:hypothetical protein
MRSDQKDGENRNGERGKDRCRDFRSAEGNLLCEFPEEWSLGTGKHEGEEEKLGRGTVGHRA